MYNGTVKFMHIIKNLQSRKSNQSINRSAGSAVTVAQCAKEEKTVETSHDEAGVIEAASLLPAAAGILFLPVLRYYGI